MGLPLIVAAVGLISLFGHDPFDEWTRALGGDWQSYVHSGAAMSRAGSWSSV